MERIKKEELLKADNVRKARYNDEDYFCVSDVSEYLKEPLKMMRVVILPHGEEALKFATLEQIEEARYPEPLSAFDQLLLKLKK